MTSSRGVRLALTILLAIYGFRLLLHPGDYSLMDSVDLPIHETGHLVFAPFGELVQMMGGTLFQLIVPSVFVGYFALRKDRHAASCVLWWVAQNCWNVSVYARDARAQELPLVGGGEHDWAYLLGRFGWLPYDQTVGQSFWWAGVALYLVAIVGALFTLVGPAEASDEPEELAAR
jgi:hypothetical protein